MGRYPNARNWQGVLVAGVLAGALPASAQNHSEPPAWQAPNSESGEESRSCSVC